MARINAYLFGAAVGGALVSGAVTVPLHAQNLTIDDLRGRITTAQTVQQAFAKTLQHCSELNGANFYFQARDRVLNLTDYHRSLDSLAMGGSFNPDTHRPWSQRDADTRWSEVQKQAVDDKNNCELVASLPFLQKKLQELQQHAALPGAPATSSK